MEQHILHDGKVFKTQRFACLVPKRQSYRDDIPRRLDEYSKICAIDAAI